MTQSMAMADTRSYPEPDRTALSLWRNRDYMLLWSGQVVSVLGSGISGIAFPLLVLALTHSPAQAGLVGAVGGLPYLILSLPAGALVDRWDRKRVMILCDVGRGINAATIPAAAATISLHLPQLYLNAVVEGTLFVFFNVAGVAALPRVVPTDQLPKASGQNEAASFASALVSPPLGGFLFQTLGRTIPFLADAISYGTSVVSLLCITTAFQGERGVETASLRSEIKAGLLWLWRQPLVRFIALLTGGLNFAGNAVYLIVIILARQEGVSPAVIGVMLAIASLGGFAGSLAAPYFQQRYGFGQVIIATVWVQAILFPLFAFTTSAYLLGAIFAGVTLCSPIYNAVQLSYRLSIIPDELQGRMNSAVRLVTYGSIPPGLALAGILIQGIGARSAILVYAGVMVLLALAVVAYPHVRHAQRLGSARG